MVILWIVFVIMVIMVRFVAPYDSNYMNGKYVTIKNPKLRSLLIDKSRFFDKTDRRKKDINKITILGIVLYVYAAVSALLSVLSYIFISKSQVEPWIIEHEWFHVCLDTLNECFSAGFIVSFLALYAGVVGVRMLQYAKTYDSKWIRLPLYVVSLILIAVSVAIVIMMLYEGII